MMLPSHLLAVVLLGLLVSKVGRPFGAREWALAIGFSVVIDLDHLLQLPVFLATHKGVWVASPANLITAMHWGHAWQGFMHTPWALTLVVPATIVWRSWIPLAFWGLHMIQDFVVAARYVVFGSREEWLIDAALLALVLGALWLDHRRNGADVRFGDHARRVFGLRARSAAVEANDAAS